MDERIRYVGWIICDQVSQNKPGFHIDEIWHGQSAPTAPDFCGRKVSKKKEKKGEKRLKKQK